MPPNIIQIVADDLGFQDIGFFNDGVTRTPNIDALFSGGARFTQAYSASPVCAPARAALLTGRYPHRTGAIDTLEGRGLDRLALRERTLADALKAAGYRTGLVGKWHNGALDPRYAPTQRGFDRFAGFSGGWMDYWDWTISVDGQSTRTDGRYLTDVWAEQATKFIRESGDTPYYLMLAFNAPHYPLQAPAELIESYLEKLSVTREVATIYAMVEIMDRAIGQVAEAVRESGAEDDTIILFASDNGPDLSGASARPNLALRAWKGKVYDGGIQVPFAMRWPARIPAGTRVDHLLHFVDVSPTLLDIAGAAAAPGAQPFDGCSMWPQISGSIPAPAPRFWQWNRYTPVARCNAAMRDGNWKLVFPPIPEAMKVTPADLQMDEELKYQPGLHTQILPGEPDRAIPPPQPAELYDIAADPSEAVDLAAQDAERVRQMTELLDAWFEAVERERRQTQRD